MLCHEPIVSTLEDEEGVTFSHKDALFIFKILSNHRVYWDLVDDGSVVNIYSREVMA